MENEKIQSILKGIPCALTTNEILELGAKCSGQGYPLQKLIDIAKTLFKTDSDSCFKFLQFVQKHELSRNIYKDFVHQPWKIQIYYSLAALALSKASKQSNKLMMEKWQKEFNKYLNLGSKVKTSVDRMHHLMHGFNSYYIGDFNRSITFFQKIQKLDQEGAARSTISFLGIAQSHFMARRYQTALQFYKKALISNRNLPIKARIGMAYCFYELQKYELAEKCFERILSLDQKCPQAYLGLATLCYRKNNIDGYFLNLRRAHQLNPNHPLVILHLSEHFLISGQYEKCQKMSEKGLQIIDEMPKFINIKKESSPRDDYELFKARFNNLIGQAHHAKFQYQQAKKYYQLAKDKGLRFNDIALAQTLAHAGAFKEGVKILEHIFTTAKPAQLKIFSQFYKTLAYLQIKSQIKYTNDQANPNHYYKQALKYNKYDYDALIEHSVHLGQLNQKKLTLKTLQTALKALQLQGKEPKVELLNNIGVSLIQDKNVEEAGGMFQRGLGLLAGYGKGQPEDELRYHALFLTLSFNKAVVLQLQHKYDEAIKIHQDLLKFNKYYVDSYVKLADILHSIGQKSLAFQILDQGIAECSKIKFQQIRIDKLYTLKGHLQHSDGNVGDCKQTFKKLGKSLLPFDQLYQICIGYETVIKKQVDKVVLKDFLRPNRMVVINICQEDHSNVFAYMMLTILFLTDNRITKQQGLQYFNQLKIAEQDFPEIQYNFGVFSLLNEEYENALFCFNRYKERTKSTKADEYISLSYLLKGDYNQCLNNLKKCMMNQPQNLKLRFQYAYASQKRVQKLYEEEKNFKDLKLSSKYLTICKKIYESISKIPTTEYIKTVDSPELKQKLKNQIIKLRSASEDRDRFVQSQLTYYGNKQKQIVEKQKRMLEEQANKIAELRNAKQTRNLFQQLGDDQEEQEERLQRQRKNRLRQLMQRQNQQANQLWQALQQKQRQKAELGLETKKKRKNNNEGRKNRKEKKNKQQKAQEGYESEPEFKEEQQNDQYQEPQYEQEQLQRRKKKKKDRQRQREDQDDKKKRKMRKKQRKQRQQRQQRGEDQQLRRQDNQDGDSEKGSNPFDEDEQINKIKEDEQLRQREEPQKKPKKKEKKDEEEIDLKIFEINP